MSVVKSVKLNDGIEVPVIAFGIGTALAKIDTFSYVESALKHGYRHFDCAWHYRNGEYTGKAMRESGIPREEIFISAKIGDFEGDPSEFNANQFTETLLKDLGVDYVDLLMLHADILVGSVTEAWKQMETLKERGLARSIGVSNFSTESLEKILKICKITPSVNQIEFHPYSLPTYLPTLIPLCKEHGIKIAAYGSLMSITRHQGGPVDQVVKLISEERGFGQSEGQILLKWAQQINGGIVITTTTKESRMAEQIKPFLDTPSYTDLSQEHIRDISDAGASAPFRNWGTNWPYFMKGEGGIEACAPNATHLNKADI
ncbi:uncharacterized protein IL334_006429 [Kwoniella shivajii]|uniref:NADP-dependent oxidoreductase domain-containing protein n=1 Tax=Kwoniella shivajii TaxID=564305 RepID=A0ABZ1D5X6_9TREE|nr:hypothetical protein IL334_006429 [Kwoniella shivajii]